MKVREKKISLLELLRKVTLPQKDQRPKRVRLREEDRKRDPIDLLNELSKAA